GRDGCHLRPTLRGRPRNPGRPPTRVRRASAPAFSAERPDLFPAVGHSIVGPAAPGRPSPDPVDPALAHLPHPGPQPVPAAGADPGRAAPLLVPRGRVGAGRADGRARASRPSEAQTVM